MNLSTVVALITAAINIVPNAEAFLKDILAIIAQHTAATAAPSSAAATANAVVSANVKPADVTAPTSFPKA